MRISLAYGRHGLPVELPPGTEVVEPERALGLPDESNALRTALRAPRGARPLRNLARPSDRVTIVVPDSTRPAPTRRVLPAVLAELDGIPSERITILIATGLHRAARSDEVDALLGAEVVRRYGIVCHNARDDAQLVDLGATASGRPVLVNRTYMQADVRITVGLVEPHFFAGFSGGAKLILPGVAGAASVLRNHDAELIGHPQARWGARAGNPIFTEQREAARRAGCEFSVNVLVNADRQITAVFAGALEAAHDAACDEALRVAMRPVAAPYDVVVTSNSGYPLDLNLYQAVKGMSAASAIVRPGGHIVIAAECSEGAGHGDFAAMLHEHASPAEMLRAIQASGHVRPDQWQNQVFAQILQRATVHVFAGGLSHLEIEAAHCRPCPDVSTRVRALAQNGARVCALPRGPETIPYVRAA
ncbi:MAG: nickel-dependent lactate racemase [Actinobacteria bacterium]|nr:nickel-dependent lactate racemase [Actinomycetota bacterium]